MKIDLRHIATGTEIPSEGYCDQPYVVVNKDGTWTCVMTTGVGHEGQHGQHVVSAIAADHGKTWEGVFDIEPGDGPEASWVMPLLVPETGRIYVFYTYNKDNLREITTKDGGKIERVDSLGTHAYRYSDDGGRTWSRERYEIPMRTFEYDRRNATGGEVMFFWGVGKPFVHKGAAYVCISKIGNFGEGFFTENEGILFKSDNLLTEHDPSKHTWETLPDGEKGLRTPEGGGPIAGEFNATPMADGSLFGTYRTVDGWSCHGYSRDDGHTWETGYMTYGPGQRLVKNPRSANFVRRFSNGKYLYWFCFHGGEVLGREARNDPWKAYAHRNPIWMCGGIEKDGYIHWSQPELILYDDKIGNRMSYPDFIEDNGRFFFTETQKLIARVHEFDPALLAAMWNFDEPPAVASEGLALDLAGDACRNGATADMPELPALYNREGDHRDDGTLNTSLLSDQEIESRGGFSLELWVRFDDLESWQVLFDTRNERGDGLLVQLTDRGAVSLTMASCAYDTPGARWSNGGVQCSWECDHGLLEAGKLHQILFIVDGGPKLIMPMVDGQLCDGGKERQFGWGRFHPNFRDPNGAPQATLAPTLHGTLARVRLYDRYLFANEGAANYAASE